LPPPEVGAFRRDAKFTKRTKVKSVYKVLKPKKAILIFLGGLVAWWLLYGFDLLSNSPSQRLSVKSFS